MKLSAVLLAALQGGVTGKYLFLNSYRAKIFLCLSKYAELKKEKGHAKVVNQSES